MLLSSAERLAGLIGGLVEGLVGDVTVVGDHGDLVRSGIFAAVVLVAAAGAKREDHDERRRSRATSFFMFMLFFLHNKVLPDVQAIFGILSQPLSV